MSERDQGSNDKPHASDTPRTDANLPGWGAFAIPTPFVEFARQLERELSTAQSAVVASMPVTQCLTAGASNAVTESERLVCSKCGCPAFQQMQYFPYDLHPHSDYPHGHPERCTKMDAWAEGLERDGKQGWRCHKRLGHCAGNGGEHCSTHRDCGFIRDGGVCGMEPDHDGPHAGEGTPQSASERMSESDAKDLARYRFLRDKRSFHSDVLDGGRAACMIGNWDHELDREIDWRMQLVESATNNATDRKAKP